MAYPDGLRFTGTCEVPHLAAPTDLPRLRESRREWCSRLADWSSCCSSSCCTRSRSGESPRRVVGRLPLLSSILVSGSLWIAHLAPPPSASPHGVPQRCRCPPVSETADTRCPRQAHAGAVADVVLGSVGVRRYRPASPQRLRHDLGRTDVATRHALDDRHRVVRGSHTLPARKHAVEGEDASTRVVYSMSRSVVRITGQVTNSGRSIARDHHPNGRIRDRVAFGARPGVRKLGNTNSGQSSRRYIKHDRASRRPTACVESSSSSPDVAQRH